MANPDQTLAALFGLDQSVVKANSDKASWAAWEKLNAWVQSLNASQYEQLQNQIASGVGWNPVGNDNGGVTTQSLLSLEQSLQKTVGKGPSDLGFKGPQATVPQPITPSGKPAPAPSPPAATTGTLNTATGAVGTAQTTAGTPIQGTAQATALIKQYMTTPLWEGAPDDAQGAAAALGVDFTSADQQYQQYVASFQKATQRTSGIYGALPKPMAETQFIQGLAQSAYGRWGPAISLLGYAWQQQNGTDMPADLAQGLFSQLQQFASRDPNGAAQLQYQMLSTLTQIESSAKTATAKGGQATNLNISVDVQNFMTQFTGIAPEIVGSSPGALSNASPSSYLGQYIAKNPAVAGEAAATVGAEKKAAIDFLTAQQMPSTAANIASLSNPQTLANMEAYVSWMQGVGMKITPDLLTTLMGMPFGAPSSTTPPPQGTGGAFLLGQKVPGSSMNYGSYSAAQSLIGSQWEEYFGRAPTMSELQWGIGQTPQDIQNFIYNSPSKVSGLTIGKYQDYSNEIQNVQGDLPVSASDDFMSSLHQAVTKK